MTNKKNIIRFTIYDKLKFFIFLAFYKVIAPFESKNHRFRIMFNEIAFLFHIFTKFRSMKSVGKRVIKLKTSLGDFYIRDIEIDWLMASPAFERQDLNMLIRTIKSFLDSYPDKEVLFLDIGASIGKYTIAIGKQLKRYNHRLKILAFEPDPEGFKLLKKNVQLNSLNNVRVYKKALSDSKIQSDFFYYEPMQMIVSFKTAEKIKVTTDTLDNILKKEAIADNIFVVLDVEGHEVNVLKGMKETVNKSSYTYLLIEDAVKQTKKTLERYLSNNFIFNNKVSQNNSFWFKQNGKN